MPLLAEFALPFLVFAGSIFLVGLTHTQTAAHGSQSSPGFWSTLTHALGTTFGLTTKIANFVVSHFAAAQLRQVARWFTAMGTLTLGWFGVNALFAEAVAGALERLERRGDPKARAKAAKAAGAAAAAAAAAHKGIRIGHSNAANLHHFQTKTDARIKPLHHATTVVLPREIGRVRGRIGPLEREYDDLRDRTKSLEDGAIKTWKWIRTHPLSGTTAVFTGAVAIALSRLGLGALRCRNFRNLLNRWGCGLGTLLNDLLGIVVAGLVLEAVCEFLPFFERAFGAVIGPVTHLLNEVPLGACETPPPGWAKLNVAAGPLPPAQTLGTLPG